MRSQHCKGERDMGGGGEGVGGGVVKQTFKIPIIFCHCLYTANTPLTFSRRMFVRNVIKTCDNYGGL